MELSFSTADAMVYRAYRFVVWQHPIHTHLTQTTYSVQIPLPVYSTTLPRFLPVSMVC